MTSTIGASHIPFIAAASPQLLPTMSTLNSCTSLTTVSNDLLAKWPTLHADLYAELDHNPDPRFFRSVPLEDLCLVGLGMTTCDLRLGPQRSFNYIHILCMSFSNWPLDRFGWVNIPIAGLVHLTQSLLHAHSNICTFQGWRLPSYEAAILHQNAKFKPCVIFIPHWLFATKPPQSEVVWLQWHLAHIMWVIIYFGLDDATGTLHSKHGGGCPMWRYQGS